MPDIELRLGKDMLVLEGAMGTMLQRAGVPAGECFEFQNVLDPEMVREVHRLYRLAGADCAITNTFGGSRAKLDAYGLGDRVTELNVAGVEAAKAESPLHVLASMGPCGLFTDPLGTATTDEVFAQYAEQAEALASAGPDAILIETMVDISDACCALAAVHEVCDLPVFCTVTFSKFGRMELSGTTPADAARQLEAAGADALGSNCGLGPDIMLPLVEQMAQVTALPLIAQPNAGMPRLDRSGETVYPCTPDEMAIAAERFRAIGVQMVGSCCGSTPAFTGAIDCAIGGTDVVPRKPGVDGQVGSEAEADLV